MSRHGRRLAAPAVLLAVSLLFPALGSCKALGGSLPRSMGVDAFARGVTHSVEREIDQAGRQVVEMVKGQIREEVVEDVAEALSLANANLGPDEEYFLGRTVLAELLTDYDNRLVGISGTGTEAIAGAEHEYVATVAGVVFEAAEKVRAQSGGRAQTGLRVAIVPHAVPNAYATPGGFALITTGMLGLISTEDELAAVLAHEQAHISLGHGVAALGRERLARDISEGIAAVERATGAERSEMLSEMAGELRNFGSAVSGALRSGYDKRWEHQADQRGANILYEAGYDPRALLAIIDRVEEWKRAGGADVGLSATHPTAAERRGALSSLPEPKLREDELRSVKSRRATRFEGKLSSLVDASGEGEAENEATSTSGGPRGTGRRGSH